MNYIDLKKLINSEIRQIKEKIENQVKKEDIDILVSKYQANNLHELIEILLCHTSKNCINLNYKDFIEELNNELYNLSFDNQLLKKQLEEIKSKYQNKQIELKNIESKEDIQKIVNELIATKNRLENDSKFIKHLEDLLEKNKSKYSYKSVIPPFQGIKL